MTDTKELRWFQKAVVYQIYPRSFCDSNSDGIGDIRGIISKLDYIKSLGVDVIWLSPVYESPNEDNGYDISCYTRIQPEFGTMDDFDELLVKAKERGIRIIMDLVINHTSSKHEWFEKSRRCIEPYTDYYYWSDEPNNWSGFFGGGTWQYDEIRKSYYLHLFAPHQPDLNYHNPLVWQSIEQVLRFWLDKGVAGFRCDVINIIYKDSLASSRKKLILTGSEHYLTLEGTHEILRRLNAVLAPYDAFTVGETVFVSTDDAVKLTSPERHELDMVFGFEHMETDQFIVKWFRRRFSFRRFIRVLEKWQREVPWNSVYFENHDQLRSVSRFGSRRYQTESAKLLATLLLTLKGTPFVYQGQEIGMTNFDFTSMNEVQDVESRNIYNLLESVHVPSGLRWKIIKGGSRDHARTPFQWDDSLYAGFSDAKPWLGVNSNHTEINAKNNLEDEKSLFHTYRRLIEIRKDIEGDCVFLKKTAGLTVFRRGCHTVILNHSDRKKRYKTEDKVIFDSYDSYSADGVLLPWQALITEGT